MFVVIEKHTSRAISVTFVTQFEANLFAEALRATGIDCFTSRVAYGEVAA